MCTNNPLPDAAPAYAELHCISNFSFLRGASFPEELVNRARELGYRALAITDECSVAGIVRAYSAIKSAGEVAANFKLIVGTELVCQDGLQLVLLARSRRGYGQMCTLISEARGAASKGEYLLTRSMLEAFDGDDCLALWLPPGQTRYGLQAMPSASAFVARYAADLQWLGGLFPGRLWISAQLFLDADDREKLTALQALAAHTGLPICASGGVQMHHPQRRPLRDTLTAIRLGKPVSALAFALPANGQQCLRTRQTLARLFPAALLQETLHIAGQCQFSLSELRYEYPRELVPVRETPQSWLRQLTEAGMKQRWPQGVPGKVKGIVNRELALIAELGYEHFFLTVHDIVVFARSRNILCQGRGSAANSAVCYCLGITAVDPARLDLLFERFLSKERDEPPDIDVDFEHERREEVIQYIYRKYGRHRAALAATVICYRRRSAIRDVGKALGLGNEQLEQLLNILRMDSDGEPVWLEPVSIPAPLLKRLVFLVQQIIGFPRHLSQHVGGFVISEGPLAQLVPVENASMADRTVIQWEKDDLETLGLLKVDVLALGMLTAIRKALDLVGAIQGRPLALAEVPAEDAQTYDMICQADTVGLFQIESRAQMSMLPRLRPRNYYDLVIQIAIVRPGPIQGDMVHPYLARRQGLEQVRYPSDAVRGVLARTLGVPIFQEQVMQIAMVAAGFSGGEADQLRRAMAAWKRKGGLEPFREKLISGMRARGYEETFAQQIYQQIKGFGDYGFPESHSASFALLAYVSAWLKRHHPAAFVCALLNSQPMGFYGPSQLVQDFQRHGGQVLPVDVQCSDEDCTLEPVLMTRGVQHHALRLGLRMLKGLSGNAMHALVQARAERAFVSIADLVRRTGLSQTDSDALAAGDALKSLAADRYRAFWDASAVEALPPLFAAMGEHYRRSADNLDLMLPRPSEAQDIVADYNHTGLTLRRHPLALWREHLAAHGVLRADELSALPDRRRLKVAGLVTCRQRPQTASGVTFLTLEDESGFINVVVWPQLLQHYYRPVHEASLLGVAGYLQQSDGVIHVVAGTLVDLSDWLGDMQVASRDFA
ncbi:MAG: error-prone DNA polymerase [Gammaproteobacteria bacterium]|nr:error-prone DNA polymerase [Gammaproteobacteria bacterium]